VLIELVDYVKHLDLHTPTLPAEILFRNKDFEHIHIIGPLAPVSHTQTCEDILGQVDVLSGPAHTSTTPGAEEVHEVRMAVVHTDPSGNLHTLDDGDKGPLRNCVDVTVRRARQ